MLTNPAHAQISQEFNEVESYMLQKGIEYRTIDKTRAGRIYERLKAYIAPPKHTIQVLGTNGKGSTGRFLALMLMQNGVSVVHFTSPHIFSFSERFYKNGAIVGDDELKNAHRFLQKFDFMAECSYFEYATFLAAVLAQGVDYLILEAGVGGELDSTSVIAREMCIFSVIDYDHTEILGESIEAIATTKLNAVWYPNRVSKMVVGAQKYEIVEKIAKEIAKTHSVEIFMLDSAESQNLQSGLPRRFCESARNDDSFLDSAKSTDFADKSQNLHFLSQNLALALRALEVLGLKCDLKTLPKLDLRGRFEAIAPNIIIDVGHNQNAAFAIKQNLGQKKVILVYNSYFQKNIRQILETLQGNIKSVQILRICDNPRIIRQEVLEQILRSLNISYKNFDGAKSIRKDENYLVFGSFTVVEAFLRDYEAHKAGMKI